MTLQQTPMRRCGRRYKTQVDAALSKGALTWGKTPVPCAYGCGGWHLEDTSSPAASAPAKKAAAADTGFSPAVKLAVRTRAGDGDPDMAVCECHGYWMGRHGGEIQHIIARGSGGTSRPEIGSVINAALMCRPGHRKAEDRDPEMYERGFWRWSSETPGAAPLMLYGRDGGFTRWLTAAGLYSTEPPIKDEADGTPHVA